MLSQTWSRLLVASHWLCGGSKYPQSVILICLWSSFFPDVSLKCRSSVSVRDVRKFKDTKKNFDRVREDMEIAQVKNAQAPRNKPHEVEEAAGTLSITRKCFRHLALDYVLQVREITLWIYGNIQYLAINGRSLCLSVCLSFDCLDNPFIRSTSHLAGVLLRIQGSAVLSVTLLGWVVLEQAASSSNQPVPNRHVLNGRFTSVPKGTILYIQGYCIFLHVHVI